MPLKNICFIGLGVMGLPMARRLVANDVDILGCDIQQSARDFLAADGAKTAAPENADVSDRDAVITMLPEGSHVRSIYEDVVFPNVSPGILLIDCSTIDVETTRDLAETAARKGLSMIDAPVSGGSPAAGTGKLSFMIGGADEAVARAMPLLKILGAKHNHFGGNGAGQAAKACHNMICGITAMAVLEGFALSEALGLDATQFYELCKGAAAQSWTLENRCPVPGVVAEAPSSHDYAPGFAAGLMAKDLRLAKFAAQSAGQSIPFGAEAADRFTEFAEAGKAHLDFSAFFETLRPSDGK